MKLLNELLQYFMFYSILFFFLQYGDNIKPELLVSSIYEKLGLEYNESAIAIHRKDVYAVDELSKKFVSLLDLGEVIR